MRESRWPPGAQVVLRSVRQSWLWFAFPAFVLRDAPDLSSWHLADPGKVELGRISAARAQEIRSKGDHALETDKARVWPYAHGWDRWTPPADWGVSELPAHWDRL